MKFVYEALLVVAAVAPLVILGLLLTRDRSIPPATLFLGVLLLDTTLTPLEYALGLHPPGLEWNWIGKVISITWALVFVRFGPLTAGEVGLTLRQRRGSVLPAAIFTLVLIAATVVLTGGDGKGNTETLLYQATMPGLAEELAMRGVFLALLHRAFNGIPLRLQGPRPADVDGPSPWRAMAWPIVITSVAFGLWHGLSIQNGAVAFEPMAFALPCLGGLCFAWLRVRTGSLVFPVIAHNGANLIGFLIG